MDVVLLLRQSEDLPLGAKPVLFLLTRFTTTAFIQRIGPLSNHVL